MSDNKNIQLDDDALGSVAGGMDVRSDDIDASIKVPVDGEPVNDNFGFVKLKVDTPNNRIIDER